MQKHIFIGVDGGGTKCRVRVVDEDNHLIGEGVGGPANIRLSVSGSWDSINQTLLPILQQHQLSLQDKKYLFHAGMGLAGSEVKEAFTEFCQHPHAFATLLLTSDSHVACLGAHKGGDGEIIIIGTGVVGFQIHGGKNFKTGGWGFPQDDEGGGAWLGMEVVRLTFQSLDKRIEGTPLLNAIWEHFDSNIDQLVSWTSTASSHEFAKLAPIVIKFSEENDPWALHLLRRAGDAISKIGYAMQRHAQTSLPCALFGGVSTFVQPWVSPDLQSRIVVRKDDANSGAIEWVKQSVLSDELVVT